MGRLSGTPLELNGLIGAESKLAYPMNTDHPVCRNLCQIHGGIDAMRFSASG